MLCYEQHSKWEMLKVLNNPDNIWSTTKEIKKYPVIKIFIISICIILCISFVGCESKGSNERGLLSGTYYIEGDYEKNLRPVLIIDNENSSFSFHPGSIICSGDNGSIEISGNELTVVSITNSTMVFEIKDKKTLLLTDIEGDWLTKVPENSIFNYSKKPK